MIGVNGADEAMLEHLDSGKGNKPHSYEVVDVKLVDEKSPTNYLEPTGRIEIPSVSAAKLLKDVEKSYDKGKNLLRESEKVSQQANSQPSEGEIDGIHYKVREKEAPPATPILPQQTL